MWGKGRIAVVLVFLVVVGGIGCLGGNPQNQSPVVSISANPSSGVAPLTVTFTISASGPDGSITSWSLDVDDDGTAEYQEAAAPPTTKQHTYNSAGTYVAKISVTDDKGTSATATQTITVIAAAANQAPNADFNYVVEGLAVHFNDDSSDPDGDILAFFWDFGDGTSSTLENPDHTYSDQGSYTVNLIVNDGELNDTTSKTITVNEPVTGHIVINEVESNPPGTDAGYEWVELYNPTGAAIDVSGWKLQTTAGVVATYTIPSGTTIQAGGYLVITFPSQFLDNDQESVILMDQSNTEIDRTPLLSDTANDAWTWQRIPNGTDTGGSSDWQFLSGTKGGSNS